MFAGGMRMAVEGSPLNIDHTFNKHSFGFQY